MFAIPFQSTVGPAGPAGAEGLSAYEVAVANGFIGTEAAWLASLQGDATDAEVLMGKTRMSGMPVTDAGAYLVTLSYVEATRTITITPTGAEWDAYVDGVRYTFIGAQSIAHANVQGGHFIYVDNTGAIVTSQVPWDLAQTAPLVYVFWDSANTVGIAFYEWHHAGRDVWLHHRLHTVEGTQAGAGFAISGYTLEDGATDAALTFGVAAGSVIDEDIITATGVLADGGPYTIFRRIGASGVWQFTRGNTLPVLHAANILQYNQFTGATWQLSNLAEDAFVNYYLFAIPALSAADQLVLIPGQVTFATEELAHGESVSSLSFGSFPFQEAVPLYQLTMRYNAVAPSAYVNTPRAALVHVTRIVGNRASLTALAQSDHGALAGLTDDDHAQYHTDARGDARYLPIASAAALLPVGGTAGQLLAKVDADNYDVEWIDPPAGGGGGPDPEGWVAIETIAWAVNTAIIDIALPWATYDQILITGSVWENTGAAVGYLRVSVDSGSVYETSGYSNAYHTLRAWGTPLQGNAASNSSIPIAGVSGGRPLSMAIRVSQPEFINVSGVGNRHVTSLAVESYAAQDAGSGGASASRAAGAHMHASAGATHLRLVLEGTGAVKGNLRVLGRTL